MNLSVQLSQLDLDCVWVAARRVEAQHPRAYVGRMPAKQADAWIRDLHRVEDAVLADMPQPLTVVEERAWVDVLLEDGRWVGQWIDAGEAIERAGVSCAYGWSTRPAAVGVGLKDEAMRAARIAGGDLLATLGGDW